MAIVAPQELHFTPYSFSFQCSEFLAILELLPFSVWPFFSIEQTLPNEFSILLFASANPFPKTGVIRFDIVTLLQCEACFSKTNIEHRANDICCYYRNFMGPIVNFVGLQGSQKPNNSDYHPCQNHYTREHSFRGLQLQLQGRSN